MMKLTTKLRMPSTVVQYLRALDESGDHTHALVARQHFPPSHDHSI